jgi:DNA-binding beta-propeller fold protein YncE
MASRRLVKTVAFPARSKPHMLRVSPDGKEVWVQTADANTNVVLDASDLAVLSTEPTGKQPVTNAWTPDRRYSVITNGQDTFAQIFDARTFKEVKRLTIGQGGSNIGFSRDGEDSVHCGARRERRCRDRYGEPGAGEPDQGRDGASGLIVR